jgi:uncharacterized membrane protein YvbJ
MKYCKRCHILYSNSAAACPKCGISKPEEGAEPQKADKKAVRRDWIMLAVGIPLFIGAIYLIIYLIKILG